MVHENKFTALKIHTIKHALLTQICIEIITTKKEFPNYSTKTTNNEYFQLIFQHTEYV